MNIYIMTQLDQITPEQFWRLFAMLPRDRQEKVRRLRTDNRKKQSAVAYLLLVHALRQQNTLTELPKLVGPGKPKIAGREDLHCSISHCEVGVAAVVNDTPVGVDIEVIRPYKPKVAKYVCSDAEIAEIEASDDPALAFTVLWTKKESGLKLYGGSIGPGMKTLAETFEQLTFETKIGDGWVVTACSERS